MPRARPPPRARGAAGARDRRTPFPLGDAVGVAQDRERRRQKARAYARAGALTIGSSAAAEAIGSETVTSRPPSRRASTATRPPWAWATARTTARPRP